MSEFCYSIVMQTSLGKKYGTLSATVSGNRLCGWLDVLEHREPFEGTIDDAGNCRVSGTLTTLMRRIRFIATGKITEAAVSLQMQGGYNMYELTGVSCAKIGER